MIPQRNADYRFSEALDFTLARPVEFDPHPEEARDGLRGGPSGLRRCPPVREGPPPSPRQELHLLPGLRGPVARRPCRQGGEGGHDDPRGSRPPHRGAPRSARLSRIRGPARGREGQGLLAPGDRGGEGGGPPGPGPARAQRPLRPVAPRRALNRGSRSGRRGDYPQTRSPESGTQDPPWSAPAEGGRHAWYSFRPETLAMAS